MRVARTGNALIEGEPVGVKIFWGIACGAACQRVQTELAKRWLPTFQQQSGYAPTKPVIAYRDGVSDKSVRSLKVALLEKNCGEVVLRPVVAKLRSLQIPECCAHMIAGPHPSFFKKARGRIHRLEIYLVRSAFSGGLE